MAFETFNLIYFRHIGDGSSFLPMLMIMLLMSMTTTMVTTMTMMMVMIHKGDCWLLNYFDNLINKSINANNKINHNKSPMFTITTTLLVMTKELSKWQNPEKERSTFFWITKHLMYKLILVGVLKNFGSQDNKCLKFWLLINKSTSWFWLFSL